MDETKDTRPRLSAPSPLLTLDKRAGTPLFRQIYEGLRQAILTGKLPQGSRLPASRALAEELGVARTTVVLAYEHLETEGYVLGRGSAGTVVAELPLAAARARPRGDSKRPTAAARREADPFGPLRPEPVAFRIGEPALDAFPWKLWTRLQGRAARRAGREMLGYGDPAGHLPLRRAITDYVRVSRGVSVEVEQVILVRGAQQAMDLSARTLLRPGDAVWVEDPGYLANRTLVKLAGAKLVPVPVDGEGLVVAAGMRAAPKARMACLAPSHHFPLGSSLSLPRRLALLDWARRSGAWIVEDDFDSEFRYAGFPITSLQGLDPAGRVIYVGTFSKTLFPALRLGYLIPPPGLVGAFLETQAAVDHLAPTLEHATLTDFIEEGHFARHVRRMRGLYLERQEALRTAAARELGPALRVETAGTGMHALGWLPPGSDDRQVSLWARRQGIEAPPLSRYCLEARLPPALLLGFAALPETQLRAGMKKLKAALGLG
jgi:GntR family transcriptional regulator/MocR family aminotransferase